MTRISKRTKQWALQPKRLRNNKARRALLQSQKDNKYKELGLLT